MSNTCTTLSPIPVRCGSTRPGFRVQIGNSQCQSWTELQNYPNATARMTLAARGASAGINVDLIIYNRKLAEVGIAQWPVDFFTTNNLCNGDYEGRITIDFNGDSSDVWTLEDTVPFRLRGCADVGSACAVRSANSNC